MNSGNFRTSTYDGACLQFDWKLKSQNTATNQSVISWTLKGAGIASGYWYRAGAFKVTIDGVTVYSSSTRIQLYTGTVVASGEYTLTHNSQGAKTFKAYAEGAIYVSSVNVKGQASFELPTIARASQPSLNTWPANSPNFNIGDKITVHMNRKSTAFTHTVALNFGSYSKTLGTGVEDNISVNTADFADSLYKQIPNSNTGKGNITVTTYNGNTVVGTASCDVVGHVVRSNPDFSANYLDTNSVTVAITEDNQKIIRNNSTLQIGVYGASAKNYASLSKLTVTVNGQAYTGSLSGTGGLVNVGKVNVSYDTTAVVRLTDSRGNYTDKELTISVYDWKLPTAIITLQRKSNYYTASTIAVNASYSSIGGKNDISAKYRIKKVSEANYGAYNSIENGKETTFDADNAYDWNVQVVVADKIGSTTYNLVLGKGIPILYIDRLNSAVGVNCFPKQSFEVDGKSIVDIVYPVGSIYMTVDSTSPATLFGGTWEALGGRFLVGADSTYKAGSTGGEAEHTLTIDEMPKHNHSIDNYNTAGGTTSFMTVTAQAKTGYGNNVQTWYTGGGKAHNNLPPYLSVYMWKRTA